MTAHLLAIDQGTSSTKAVLVDAAGSVVARASARVGCTFPQPGWVEQDPEGIWESVLVAVRACLEANPEVVPAAIAISNQRESAVVWRRSDGMAVGPLIGWQDNRTAPDCERLRSEGVADMVRTRTGLALDPMFSATKLRWLLERAPGGVEAAARGELCAGTVDAWLIHRLTQGAVFACEAGNASRTQLLNLREVAWDPELLELFGIPEATLPELRGSNAGFGTTAAQGPIPGGLPIAAVLADSHAALYGHGGFLPGSGKATYGTGTSVMTITEVPAEAAETVAQTLAWLTDRPTWAFEGNIIASGAAIDWMAEILGLEGGSELQALAATVSSSAGLALVPAFTGLGAPYWDRNASGVIAGVTRGSSRAELALAAVESVALQVCDVVEAMELASGQRLEVLRADGGGTAGAALMQCQADLLGRPVLASTTAEMSALGAAHMGGTAVGLWNGEEALAALSRPTREYRPQLDVESRENHRESWAAAVARSRGLAVHHELEESLR
jgi:glycerol kinase